MSPKTDKPSTGPRPDALRDIYLDAVQDDAGPSAQSSERILAHARAEAERAGSRGDASQAAVKTAANDGFWLRQAVAGVAAIGLVGWLLLQHMAGLDDGDKREAGRPASSTAAHEPARAAAEESAKSAAATAGDSAAPPADAARSRTAAPRPASPAPSSAPPLARPADPLADQSASRVARPEARVAEAARNAKQSRQETPLPLCAEEQALPAAVPAEKVAPATAAASAELAAKTPGKTPADSKVNSGSESPVPACRPRPPAARAPAQADDAAKAEAERQP